ncbi:uncharacterized protein BCR38DRAFT_421169 [Pseudomassariella vexata]|uniref:Uncharacterized protein n=1 Tax=Pseudomassariella vexata TaxID=1141098 RepID=A0A1Y2EF07_9PEZI|nr:uncharacterized protein BCR38DRAFT_421169 [Pseudomassariella vexata]ORY70162.1 hypothetical protein BCR38DRAFT_421169 [Pseudomassariella vexata]
MRLEPYRDLATPLSTTQKHPIIQSYSPTLWNNTIPQPASSLLEVAGLLISALKALCYRSSTEHGKFNLSLDAKLLSGSSRTAATDSDVFRAGSQSRASNVVDRVSFCLKSMFCFRSEGSITHMLDYRRFSELPGAAINRIPASFPGEQLRMIAAFKLGCRDSNVPFISTRTPDPACVSVAISNMA